MSLLPATVNKQQSMALLLSLSQQLPVRGPSITVDQLGTAKMLARTTNMSAQRIADVIGVSRATLYRHMNLGDERQEASL